MFFASSFCSQNQLASPKYHLSYFWERLSPGENCKKTFQKQMCRANRVKPSHGCTRSNNEAARNTAEKKSLQAAVRDLGSLGSFWTPSNLPERGCWKNKRKCLVAFGKIIMPSLSILLLHGIEGIQGILLSKYHHDQGKQCKNYL